MGWSSGLWLSGRSSTWRLSTPHESLQCHLIAQPCHDTSPFFASGVDRMATTSPSRRPVRSMLSPRTVRKSHGHIVTVCRVRRALRTATCILRDRARKSVTLAGRRQTSQADQLVETIERPHVPLGVGHAEVLEQHLRRDAPAISSMALELHTKLVDCDQPLEKPPLAFDLASLPGSATASSPAFPVFTMSSPPCADHSPRQAPCNRYREYDMSNLFTRRLPSVFLTFTIGSFAFFQAWMPPRYQ